MIQNIYLPGNWTNDEIIDDRKPLHLMGFASVNIGETGWSSAGSVLLNLF